jgi:hypothetical protein
MSCSNPIGHESSRSRWSRLTACLVFVAAMSAVPALANMCRTDSGRMCATGMPVDGYCRCGQEGGTVMPTDHVERRHRPPPPDRPPPDQPPPTPPR